jgi:hypothetical protein
LPSEKLKIDARRSLKRPQKEWSNAATPMLWNSNAAVMKRHKSDRRKQDRYRKEIIDHHGDLVWGHTARSTNSSIRWVVAKGEDAAAPGTTNTRGAVLHLARLLSEGEGLSAAELDALTKLVEAAFARLLVLLSVHPKVVLWIATGGVRMVEAAVPTVEDVDLGERQSGIAMLILFTIMRTHKLSPA